MFNGKYHKVFTSTTSFQIVGKDTISSFTLSDLMWDDNIMVWLNGHLVFTSIPGATQMTMGCSTTYMGETTWHSNYIWTGSNCRYDLYEGGSAINNYGGAELKELPQRGYQYGSLKVAIRKERRRHRRVSKHWLIARTNCTVNGINECATLERRAK